MAGRRAGRQVIYEMHIGTFTPEGTWQAATRTARGAGGLGITVIEVMPVADFPGRFGWGYDGVNLFAPTRLYGTPDDFRALRRRGARCGLGVILDVVYNHFGPDGNYLGEFSPATISPTATRTTGARRSTSTATTPARCASSSSPMPATGSTNFISTACGSTPRSRSSTPRRTTIHDGDWPQRARRRPRSRRRSSSPRTSRRTRSWFARERAAATAWTRCGTTIFITAPWSR